MSPTEPHTARPESLEAKFRLLSMLPYDKRAKRKHCLVFGFILDWYHSKYGDALASVRHVTSTIKERDPDGVGLYAGDVHAALTDLVAWGWLEQEKGTGRRASRYVPVWAKLHSVHKTPNTTDDEISVRENQNTSVRETPNTTAASVRETPNEDPSTLTRSLDPGTGKDDIDCGAPSVGLSATAAPQDGFEELYSTYGVKRDKAAARRAYDKLNPSPDLQRRMVDAAKAWRDAAGSIERMHLSRWIREERYDEDPKGERKPKPEKTTAPQPDNDDQSRQAVDFLTYRRARGSTISRAEVSDGSGTKMLEIWFATKDGVEVRHLIVVESPDADEQVRGQDELARLLKAVDLNDIDSASELVGHTVDLTTDNNEQFVSVSRDWIAKPARSAVRFEPRMSPVARDVVETKRRAKDWADKASDDEEAA